MGVSEDYLTYALDQLRSVGDVAVRKMFGGVGLFLDGLMFALIADDVLYFKVDDSNRPDFEAASMCPFRPREKKKMTMQYYEVPIDVLDDVDEVRLWANKAFEVALRKAKKK